MSGMQTGSDRRTVRFHDIVTTYLIPKEDRRSPWMTMALDRRRFQRRIRETEKIIGPILELKLVEFKLQNCTLN